MIVKFHHFPQTFGVKITHNLSCHHLDINITRKQKTRPTRTKHGRQRVGKATAIPPPQQAAGETFAPFVGLDIRMHVRLGHPEVSILFPTKKKKVSETKNRGFLFLNVWIPSVNCPTVNGYKFLFGCQEVREDMSSTDWCQAYFGELHLSNNL